MFYRLTSATVIGVDAELIEIEVDLRKGLPQFTIVGLPDPAVKEAKERVNSAIRNSGYDFPLGRLTINLAPADIRKEGAIFDLGIALGVLMVSKQLKLTDDMADYIIVGELSLDGYVRPIHGALAILEKVKRAGIQSIILPYTNYREALLISGLNLFPVKYLTDAVDLCSGRTRKSDLLVATAADRRGVIPERVPQEDIDFSEVKGQSYAVRAAEIAAAGGHNLLFIGSPGSGKTMIASRLPTIIPPLSEKESVETSKIYSIAGLLTTEGGLITRRPFRAPHHTASEISIIGGGKNPIPGEITLAHNGILFLDEFTEFKASIVQSLRQPMESGQITVSRADSRLTFPARFMLVASMNPCPCGFYFDQERNCQCTSSQIGKYYMKISGPVLDRIDIQVQVKPLKAGSIMEHPLSVTSSVIRERVLQARRVQKERLNQYGLIQNAMMGAEALKKLCPLNSRIQKILYDAVDKFKLSVRAYYKVLRVARTIADLESRETIALDDVLEALSYREVENILYSRNFFRGKMCSH
jgi:magnesium chelatase family protein